MDVARLARRGKRKEQMDLYSGRGRSSTRVERMLLVSSTICFGASIADLGASESVILRYGRGESAFSSEILLPEDTPSALQALRRRICP